jgi:hypothetical protein
MESLKSLVFIDTSAIFGKYFAFPFVNKTSLLEHPSNGLSSSTKRIIANKRKR